MKKFSLKLVLLILPFVILFSSMEYYVQTESTFSIKKKFLENNLSSIEVLVFGSSHNQNAINPEFLDKKTSNMAFGSQSISIDYFLLDKYLDQLPKLKIVLFEISIRSFYNDFDKSNWNGYIYSNLYNIDYKVDKSSLKKYSLVYSNLGFFSTIFFDYCNPYKYKYEINKYGFITNDFHDRFEKLNYDSIQINRTYEIFHEFTNKDNLKLNKVFVEKFIKRCVDRNIKLIFITPPLYKTYYSQIPNDAKITVDNFVKSLSVKYNINYYNYTYDKRFNIRDFKNDNHLNSNGAFKFCQIINKNILDKNE